MMLYYRHIYRFLMLKLLLNIEVLSVTKFLMYNLPMSSEVLDLQVKIERTKLLYDDHEIHQVIVDHQPTITIIFKINISKKNPLSRSILNLCGNMLKIMIYNLKC